MLFDHMPLLEVWSTARPVARQRIGGIARDNDDVLGRTATLDVGAGELDGDVRLRSVVLGPGGVQGHVDARSTAKYIYKTCERCVVSQLCAVILTGSHRTLKKFPTKKDVLFLAISVFDVGFFEVLFSTYAAEPDHVHQ